MANQINYIHKEAVVEMSIVDNDIEIIGCIKAEITEKIALIHPFMYKPTKTNFLLLKKVFNNKDFQSLSGLEPEIFRLKVGCFTQIYNLVLSCFLNGVDRLSYVSKMSTILLTELFA